MKKLRKTKRITKATFKAFAKRNRENLFVRAKSSFDGMHDCVMPASDNGWRAAEVDESKIGGTGSVLNGVYLVGDSRDYFTEYEDETYYGIEVYNSCGCSIVAIKKEIEEKNRLEIGGNKYCDLTHISPEKIQELEKHLSRRFVFAEGTFSLKEYIDRYGESIFLSIYVDEKGEEKSECTLGLVDGYSIPIPKLVFLTLKFGK